MIALFKKIKITSTCNQTLYRIPQKPGIFNISKYKHVDAISLFEFWSNLQDRNVIDVSDEDIHVVYII